MEGSSDANVQPGLSASQVIMQQPAEKLALPPQLVRAMEDMEELRGLSKQDNPTGVLCPMCEQRGVTFIEKHTSVTQYVTCLGVFAIGGYCGCCVIPFWIESLQDTVHKCPNPQCQHVLGRKTVL